MEGIAYIAERCELAGELLGKALLGDKIGFEDLHKIVLAFE